jgi:hypothetical protein
MDEDETTLLWRPVGPEELELVRQTGWRAWPPRLPGQPIFYPVLSEEYAIKIARDWNVPASGAGYVTRFRVRSQFAARYPVRQVGGQAILELWIPAKDLDELNANIVGRIEIVHEFTRQRPGPAPRPDMASAARCRRIIRLSPCPGIMAL